MKIYHAPGLYALRRSAKVRSMDDAARVFAHRLARKMFGRRGLCLEIRRLSYDGSMGIYNAQLGTRSLRGPWVRIPVTNELLPR